MDSVVSEAQLPETEQHSSQVFVDASGRRARRMTRCGYMLGLGCVGYIGMVAMGLSGTRVAALPGVPTSADNEIIAGLSGEGGSIGLHLTPVPVAAQPARTTPARVTEAHSAAVRSAAAHAAALTARGALTRTRTSANVPGALTASGAQQATAVPQSRYEQVLAEGGTPADTADPSESKSQEKAEQKADAKADSKAGKKSDGKHSKQDSADKSAEY